MSKTMLSLLAGTLLIVFFTACGSDNPFLGEWEVDTEASAGFSEDTAAILFGSGLSMVFYEHNIELYLNDELVLDKSVVYNKNRDNTWSLCDPDSSMCEVYEFLDRDTIRIPQTGQDIIMNRL
ncbi:MAG: hypothetical protein LBF40_02735 [Deltaproteobacteria bacterium]|jgi:hypothetical protein|nr:hypothetical protein [Deltaproteobacteria bacterium]